MAKVGIGLALLTGVPLCSRHIPVRQFVTLIFMASLWVASRASASSYPYLRSFEIPHPLCDGEIDLEVKADYFVPIANPVAGREEYNEMVRLYSQEQWGAFDKAWADFAKNFKESPLLEAVSFLMAQSRMDRASKNQAEGIREAERAYREVVLAYPKSSLEPAIAASFGAFLLRVEDYQKAMRIYEDGKQRYSDHALSCVFELGGAEAAYQLRDFEAAQPRFQSVRSRCRNARVLFAARMRLADIAKLKGQPEAVALYETTVGEFSTISTKFFQSILYNLGEIKFQANQWPEADYYFTEFLKNDSRNPSCVPFAMKRQADILLRRDGGGWKKAAGLYSAVHLKAPKTDVGRLSRIRSLLLGMDEVGKAEFARRQKLIEEAFTAIEDPAFQRLSLVEQALSQLDQGKTTAIAKLAKLKNEVPHNLTDGEVGAFIRKKTYEIITQETEKQLASPLTTEKLDTKIFAPVESAYLDWWKGFEQEAPAAAFYKERLLHRFFTHSKGANVRAAIALLKRWHDSPLWPKSLPAAQEKEKIAQMLVSLLLKADSHQPGGEESYRTELSVLFLEHEAVLNAFIKPQYEPVWIKVALLAGDDARIKSLVPAESVRKPASVAFDANLSEEIRSHFWLIYGQAYAKLGAFSEAEKAFSKVKLPSLKEETARSRFYLYRDNKLHAKAFIHGEKLFEIVRGGEKAAIVQQLGEVAREGKLWEEATILSEMAKRAEIPERDLKPYYLLAARAYYELKDCNSAVTHFELGLKDTDGSRPWFEEKFQWGRCLVKIRRPAQAKKLFEDIIKSNDPTWAPLAQSEIHLIP